MSITKDIWEWLFHWSNITHIANAYPHDIWVSFYSDNLRLKKSDIELAVKEAKPSAQINAQLENVSNTSWVKVTHGTVHRQNRRSKTERITIVCETTLDRAHAATNQITGSVLLLNYEVQQNYSYILTKNAGFLQQKYGSNNLFEDYLGGLHEP